MAGKPRKKREDTFYRDLGSAIRLARVTAGKSQADVAEHLDVTFQQLQKYEKGDNRIPVQELVRLADYLEVPLTHLADTSGDDAAFASLSEKLTAKGFNTLLESWGAIKDQAMRNAIIHLVKCAAGLKG